jgi:hypothetical protein
MNDFYTAMLSIRSKQLSTTKAYTQFAAKGRVKFDAVGCNLGERGG